MEIVVCVKQVPDTTDVKVDPQTKTLVRDGVRAVLNPFDAFAIEEGLRIKERFGSGRVTVITMGPPQARAALEEALAMGADDAALISHRAFAGSDTLATSYALSQAIKRIGKFDIVVCGKQAADGDTAQVGPGIAVRLGIPQIIFVNRIAEISKERIVAWRITEEGHEVVETRLPCLISVVKEANVPRYASFSGKVRARRAQIPVWGPEDIGCDEAAIGLDGSPTWVDRIFAPAHREGARPVPATDENIGKAVRALAPDLSEIWASRS
ncbi:MAG: electron transfer flavoprotein subunit beta/FixA family protein [Proteobacteria bacterium]|nr:electron transfer flavoprotein subunit beta/FixA family protein [Pseudomonadota bacterium]